jgi:hypothetical protein
MPRRPQDISRLTYSIYYTARLYSYVIIFIENRSWIAYGCYTASALRG